jgi:hypothetical protein
LAKLLAATALLFSSAAAETTAATPPDDFFGVSAPELYSMTLDGRWALRDAALGYIEDAGIDTVRTEIGWRDVEPAAPVNGVHTYNWTSMFNHVYALAQHGQSLTPMMLAPPGWAQDPASAGACQRRGGITAESVDDYAAFVRAVAEMFGRGGAYWDWAAVYRPALPQRPITTYELWNEPNWDSFWCPDINPEVFAAAVAEAGDAIHAVDPQATVSVGGLVVLESNQFDANGHLTGMKTRAFIQRMSAAEPELASKVDAVALHTYWDTPDDNLRALSLVEGWLDEFGLGRERLVVSEYGWRSGGLGGILEGSRAPMMRDYTDKLARTNCGVTQIFPHSWITPRINGTNPEDWFGMAEPLTGAPMPTGIAYAEAIESYRSGSASEQPTLDVCSPDPAVPGAPALTAKPANPSTSASARFEYSESAASTWRCRLDQQGWEPCPAAGKDVSGLGDGTHTFAVQAVNSLGEAGPETTYEWTVDAGAPETQISGPQTTIDATASFQLTSSEPGSTFRCRFDAQAWRSCGSVVDDGGIPDGAHVLEAVAVDAAGNADPTPARHGFSLWSTPAAPAITGGPAANSTTGRSTRFDFAVASGTTAECRVDGAAFGACTGAGSHSLASLSHGVHTFDVRAVGAGGVRSAVTSRQWTVDAQGPQVTLKRKSKLGAKPVVFTVSATDPSGVVRLEYRLDGGAWKATAGTISISQPGSARHVIEARAFDRYANQGTASSLSWRLRMRHR